jgi:hypothetical protein
VDPAQVDPIHPWHPAWLKPGQTVTHHVHGQRHLGHLQLTDSFCWAFTQCDETSRRVLEIELTWLAIGKNSLIQENWRSVTAPLPGYNVVQPLPQSPNTLQPSLRPSPGGYSGQELASVAMLARHVSAHGLTRPTPQFLWQSMKFPKDSPDYRIWPDSYKEEHDGLKGLDL